MRYSIRIQMYIPSGIWTLTFFILVALMQAQDSRLCGTVFF